ncbi:MAG: chorismate mutase [Clostridiales bacterium]|nr:chorismate mutase [Clostridiales bacterium]
MTELENIRSDINSIDKQMAELFEKRMNLVKEVAQYKISNNTPVHDAQREQSVVEKNSAYINDENLKKYYISFILSVMGISKEYQNKLIENYKSKGDKK